MEHGNRTDDERHEGVRSAQERGWITIEEIVRLSSGSPADPELAERLTRDAGIALEHTDDDPWSDIEKLAHEGPETFRAVREGPAAGDISADNAAALYLREISRTPLLSADEEIQLAKEMEAGRAAQARLDTQDQPLTPAERTRLETRVRAGDAARRRMIEANLRLVVSMAKKFMNRGLSFLDLVQEGNIGLQKGVEKYDWRRGFRFSTYAYWWIRQAIGRAVAEQGRTVRLPVHIIEQLTRLYNAARELQYELGRPPSPQEIGDRVGLPLEKVQEAFRAARMPISLETPVGEDATATLGEFISDSGAASPAQEAEEGLLAEQLGEALYRHLGPREAEIVRLRFGLDRGGEERTLGEVGKQLGISRERVRQLEAEAMLKLRRAAPFRQQFQDYAA